MASIPSRTLLGAERVVMVCDADSSLSRDEIHGLCAQLAKKAQSVTSLPVSVVSRESLADTKPGEQVVLHVALSASGMKADRGSLAVTVTPSRNYLNFEKGAPLKSDAQLARIQGRLVVQGPVDAFGKLLGGVPPKLQQPIVSDR